MKGRQCNSPSFSKSINGEEEEYSESIPFDLVIEILTRLPAKSVARIRCVSKLWNYTIRGPNFTESFFTISSSRPKLMFTCLKDGKTFFLTSPQPQSNSSPLAANLQISFPIKFPQNVCRPVRGLVCGVNQLKTSPKRMYRYVPLICNPSTGQCLTLPLAENSRELLKICLCYDPVHKQFKVLCTYTAFTCDRISDSATSYQVQHQVLTLGTGEKLLWRRIRCDIPHSSCPVEYRDTYYYSVYDEVCINGVCYYFARIDLEEQQILAITCFDVRSEKFSFLRLAQGMSVFLIDKFQTSLINYKEKLAKLQMNGIYTAIHLWVLKDAEKHEWLNYSYDFPVHPGDNIVGKTKLRCVGMTTTDEIVLSTQNVESVAFYLLYYNTKRNTIRRFEIQGMEAYKTCRTYTFLDHVEDVKLYGEDLGS